MQIKANIILPTVAVILSILTVTSTMALSAPVTKGERPNINLSYVPEDAYMPGVFRIKFNPEWTRHLDSTPVRHDSKGIVIFGIDEADTLNARYGVHDANPVFSSGAFDQKYGNRHRKWGLHLWYELNVDADKDIIHIIKDYAARDMIAVAEPIYAKRLVSEVFTKNNDNNQDNGGKDSPGEGYNVMPDDEMFDAQWHYDNNGQTGGLIGADINLPEAWMLETGSEDVIVAVLDHGVDYEHPDLIQNMWEGAGYNFVADSPNISPGNHGTHVAGTIAAVNNNQVGVSGIAGGWGDNPGVQIISAQIFTSHNYGGVENAMIWAADTGAAISQNSWEYIYAEYYEVAVLDAIDYFNANGGGQVMDGGISIFASGNSNSTEAFYPGYYSGTMAVAATNHQDQRSYYSNYGEWIDLSAPGGETLDDTHAGVLSTIVNDYGYMQGTSMACPHVSGVAALVLSMAEESITANELEYILTNTADELTELDDDDLDLMGEGRLNALEALLHVHGMNTGIYAPAAFSAALENNHTSILSWEKNDNNNRVIIAVNDRGIFGEPGTEMQPDDTIPGGGTIIYKGNGKHYLHQLGESPDQSYYRIWSGDDNTGKVSYGRQLQVKPDAPIAFLPLNEPFSNDIKPFGWATQLTDAGTDEGADPAIAFIQQGQNPDAQPAEDSQMVMFNSASGRDNAAMRLITPAISSINMPFVKLSFYWHYHNENPEAGDRMRVEASLDMANWSHINTFDRFGEESGWEEKQIYLPSQFYNQEKLYLAFHFETQTAENTNGGNMYLDHIRVTTDPDLIVPGFNVNKTEAITEEMIVITNQTAGENIDTLEWFFGESAKPSTATGSGPHVIRYMEPGEKDMTLLVNGNEELHKTSVLSITENPLESPSELSATILNDSDIMLEWIPPAALRDDHPRENHELTGYNVYRDGIFLQNIPVDTVLSYTDQNVPEGWLNYEVRAYYTQPLFESPAAEITLALNEVTLTLESGEGGNTNPEPGSYPMLAPEMIQLTAEPLEEYVFSHWIINEYEETDVNPFELEVTEDTHVKAVFESTVNIDPIGNSKIVEVYPNPASQTLNIRVHDNFQTEQILILSLNGALKKSIKATEKQPDGLTTIDLKGLSTGIYILQLKSKETSISSKIIIQH